MFLPMAVGGGWSRWMAPPSRPRRTVRAGRRRSLDGGTATGRITASGHHTPIQSPGAPPKHPQGRSEAEEARSALPPRGRQGYAVW